MKVLVLGVSGMLGNAMYRVLSEGADLDVYGTARSFSSRRYFFPQIAEKILIGVDVENHDALERVFTEVKPHVVVNCVGLIKQHADANDPLVALPINSMLPHRLARLCDLCGARLVHVSTDCVFAGTRGNYRELDKSDAEDLYGKSKFIGEVTYPHTITLRTSIIGHELNSANGLIGWFLAQERSIKGYTHAIFSGLPTCELATVVRDVVLPKSELHGLYHVAAEPISKYELLRLVNQEYKKNLNIEPDEQLKINRSLNAQRFQEATGYQAPPWPQLISQMRTFQ